MEMVKLFKLCVFFQIYFNVGITIFFRFYRPWAIFIILDALGAAYAMNVLMAFPLLLILIIKSTVSMIFPSNYRIKIFCAISRNIFATYDFTKKNIFFFRLFAPSCAACGEGITPFEGTTETVKVEALGKDFHVDCYVCEVKKVKKFEKIS